jgi:peptidoglycan hydrolase-like protein with peptidoglycan-binding domain
MWLSNDAAFSTGSWMPIQALYPWTLTNSIGTKTVYARFGSSNTIYATNQASIVLTALNAGASVVAPVTTGTVLGTSTTLCSDLLTKTLRYGNSGDEVKKLQNFLNTKQGEKLPVTGYFGGMTRDAVKRFQTKYASIVLTPLGLTTPTGIVGAATRAQINTLACTLN